MLDEILFFSQRLLALRSKKMERQMLVQSNKKEVHDKVKPELFVKDDIY